MILCNLDNELHGVHGQEAQIDNSEEVAVIIMQFRFRVHSRDEAVYNHNGQNDAVEIATVGYLVKGACLRRGRVYALVV